MWLEELKADKEMVKWLYRKVKFDRISYRTMRNAIDEYHETERSAAYRYQKHLEDIRRIEEEFESESN